MNPYMPATEYMPDGEPRVFEFKGEKRLFIYGSRDETARNYCGFGHNTWSAPLDDLTSWTNHGEIFHMDQLRELGHTSDEDTACLAAPDCVYNPKNGRYYLYVFTSYDNPETGFKIWVATSDSPAGPFKDPQPCAWPSVNKRNSDFDPAVLIDDDGRVYAYWGFSMPCWAELDPIDMRTIIPHTFHAGNSGLPFFFEGPSIRKVEGIYVLVYSGKPANTMQYSYSSHPLGPWIPGGPIVSNADNGMPGGNDHGGIIEINGKWYINYHRPSPSNFSRQAMMEPVDVTVKDGKVYISRVMMTSQGVEENGLSAFKRYHAAIMCYKEGHLGLTRSFECTDGLHPVAGIKDGAVAGYLYMNFGEKRISAVDSLKFKANIRAFTDGCIEVYVNDPQKGGPNGQKVKIGQMDFKANDNWAELSAVMELVENPDFDILGIDGLKGSRGVFIRFGSQSAKPDEIICEFKELEFALGDAPTPNPKHTINIHVNDDNTQITAIPSRARAGESVLIKPSAKGLDLSGIKISYGNGSMITANINGDGTREFMMPNAEVKIVV